MIPADGRSKHRRATPPSSTAAVIAGRTRNGNRRRTNRPALDRPVSIYEVHLGSWRRVAEDGDRWLSYRELAEELVPTTSRRMGFTHVEFLPITEHPVRRVVGLSAHRLFRADQPIRHAGRFRYLVDRLHQPRHRRHPRLGARALPARRTRPGATSTARACTSTQTRGKGEHPDWGTLIFNYGRHEVRNFLHRERTVLARASTTSTACASMRSRRCCISTTRARDGEWIPNQYGGRENLEAIEFLQEAQRSNCTASFPGVLTIAEESTAWPGCRGPPMTAAWASA